MHPEPQTNRDYRQFAIQIKAWAVELGFAADEMLYEEDRVSAAAVLAEVASMLRTALLDLTATG